MSLRFLLTYIKTSIIFVKDDVKRVDVFWASVMRSNRGHVGDCSYFAGIITYLLCYRGDQRYKC